MTSYRDTSFVPHMVGTGSAHAIIAVTSHHPSITTTTTRWWVLFLFLFFFFFLLDDSMVYLPGGGVKGALCVRCACATLYPKTKDLFSSISLSLSLSLFSKMIRCTGTTGGGLFGYYSPAMIGGRGTIYESERRALLRMVLVLVLVLKCCEGR